MTTDIPPPEIVGAMRRETPAALKAARREWVTARREDGWTLNQISAALGIGPPSVHGICERGPARNRQVLTAKSLAHATGVKIGHCGGPFDKMPPDIREALAMTAARQRKTVAEVLVESYAATLTK